MEGGKFIQCMQVLCCMAVKGEERLVTLVNWYNTMTRPPVHSQKSLGTVPCQGNLQPAFEEGLFKPSRTSLHRGFKLILLVKVKRTFPLRIPCCKQHVSSFTQELSVSRSISYIKELLLMLQQWWTVASVLVTTPLTVAVLSVVITACLFIV